MEKNVTQQKEQFRVRDGFRGRERGGESRQVKKKKGTRANRRRKKSSDPSPYYEDIESDPREEEEEGEEEWEWVIVEIENETHRGLTRSALMIER
ncbi:hypothetical protein PRIPAC_95773 [Pristionchus pacificus]|uniref:Uncharacterized protein n=1 Tax=Pristionchus pacificus TaxID=54126 RepID=A0A2A6D0Y8_PRIPA|nr:hypothetical protein PRIPAC_95773 [Pristionchus pacificus]|eukprot:PDM84124.1 hypothetical protein PRIPAC_34316 [Pristionchus pacificus]